MDSNQQDLRRAGANKDLLKREVDLAWLLLISVLTGGFLICFLM